MISDEHFIVPFIAKLVNEEINERHALERKFTVENWCARVAGASFDEHEGIIRTYSVHDRWNKTYSDCSDMK